MSKYTKGPWEVENPVGGYLTVVNNAKSPDWGLVAICDLPTEDNNITKMQVLANASLIAAAPDLAFAAARALDICGEGFALSEAGQLLAAALAKAEGLSTTQGEG